LLICGNWRVCDSLNIGREVTTKVFENATIAEPSKQAASDCGPEKMAAIYRNDEANRPDHSIEGIFCHAGDAAPQGRAYRSVAAACRAGPAGDFANDSILRGGVPYPLAEGSASVDNCARRSLFLWD